MSNSRLAFLNVCLCQQSQAWSPVAHASWNCWLRVDYLKASGGLRSSGPESWLGCWHLWKLLVRSSMHQTRYHFLTAGKLTCRWPLSALRFSPFHLVKPQVPHITDVGSYFPRETHVKEQFHFWRKVPLFFPLFSGPLHHSRSNNDYPLLS